MCLRYLRGMCPYQRRGGGGCGYAHFEVKASQSKKFASLTDFVCGRTDDSSGYSGGNGHKKKNFDRKHSSGHHAGTPGSYGEEGGSYMENNLSGRQQKGGGRRRRSRGGSLGSEHDSDNVGVSDNDGFSSRGSSPGRASPGHSGHGSMLSSSPHSRIESFELSISDSPQLPPLDLRRLVTLELINCGEISRAYLRGPSLVKLSFRGCSGLNHVYLEAPMLTALDVSYCDNLSSLPLREDSMRGLRVADFTGCRKLNEVFMGRLVDHCRALRQLHIFGSGASERASNSKSRQKVKTKSGLTKLTAGRPKLDLVTTKKEWRALNIQAKKERNQNRYEYDEVSGTDRCFNE